MAFRRQVGKDKVYGVGTDTVIVRGLAVEQATDLLLHLAYRFVSEAGRGVMLANLLANVLVLPTEDGVRIELEEPVD